MVRVGGAPVSVALETERDRGGLEPGIVPTSGRQEVMKMPRWLTRSPRLVHLTVANALPIIADLGLRPAAWLVANADGLSDEQREHLLTVPRQDSVWIRVRGHQVRLRDQKPLGLEWTSRLIEVEDPADYLRTLNSHTFLFPSSAAGLERLMNKYVEDRLLLELDTGAVLGDPIIAARARLVDHNPGAMSFDPRVRHLTRTKWRTIEEWDDAHPGGKQPFEVMIRDGLSPLELEEVLVDVTTL